MHMCDPRALFPHTLLVIQLLALVEGGVQTTKEGKEGTDFAYK
jgi:hypothetical protein